MASRLLCWIAFLAALAPGLSLVAADQPDFGTFANPSVQVRPRFRYWVPDASVDVNQVAADIAEVGRVGGSGIELLGYYLYGYEQPGPVAVDWTEYSWGTPAWKNVSDAALRATLANNLIMDYSLGPNQGAGVPSEPDADGLIWTLAPFNVSVPIGGTFDDVLPGWGSGDLVSASTGLVLNSTNVTLSKNGFSPSMEPGVQATLQTSSLHDVTSQVDDSGHLTVTFPSNSSGENYVVFAYYQYRSGYRELPASTDIDATVPQSPIESFVYNGSWVVDHLSAAGAQAIIDFWEEYVLSDETRDLLNQVGNFGWEDSQEFGGAMDIWWTPNILDAFNSSRGYDLHKYLPLMFAPNNVASTSAIPSTTWYVTDESDLGQDHIEDFRQTITELNQIYLKALTNWTESISNGFSAQVVYNLDMDMLANIPLVDAPECESLGFSHLIDGYKQFAGAANLAGRHVISSELGAEPGEVFAQTLPELIWDVKRSILGGINQFVYHGFPYSGDYPNTTWPVFTTFQYSFSGMHGPSQPAWDYYSDYMNWTARMQFAAQSGVAKSDIAIWLKVEDWFGDDGPNFPKFAGADDLVTAGYSYEYLSPDNFGLPAATVEDTVFAPNQQAFKALVIPQNASTTPFGVSRLADFANAGLQIFFADGLPTNFYGYNASGEQYVNDTLKSLTSLSNVHTVSTAGIADALSSAGIAPRTSVSANATWYTFWRQDGITDYVFVYNDATGVPRNGAFSAGNVTFASTGAPYWYDAWTGETSPVGAYEQTDDTTTINLSLAGNQSVVLAFLQETASPHLANASGTVVSTDNGVTIKTDQPGTATFTNGSTVAVDGGNAPIELTNWNLTIESWTPADDLFNVSGRGARTNTTYTLTSLHPWSDLGAQDVSGRGYYSSRFNWSSTDGAYLDLGGIFHTAQAWVNGQALPPLDPTWARADIGSLLKAGENTVEVVVATTLNNAAAKIWSQLISGGTKPSSSAPALQEYGLLAPVKVVPYKTTELAL